MIECTREEFQTVLANLERREDFLKHLTFVDNHIHTDLILRKRKKETVVARCVQTADGNMYFVVEDFV